MTDPIDTALLPCPFCGKSETAIIEDPPPKPQWAFVKCVRCHCAGPTCGSRATAIKRWNTRAASQADTARQEGIALGLAMAARMIQTCDCEQYCKLGDACPLDARRDIQEGAPIPPHVAAARVLLDAMDQAIWRPALESAWRRLAADEGGVKDALRAALEQIASDAA